MPTDVPPCASIHACQCRQSSIHSHEALPPRKRAADCIAAARTAAPRHTRRAMAAASGVSRPSAKLLSPDKRWLRAASAFGDRATAPVFTPGTATLPAAPARHANSPAQQACPLPGLTTYASMPSRLCPAKRTRHAWLQLIAHAPVTSDRLAEERAASARRTWSRRPGCRTRAAALLQGMLQHAQHRLWQGLQHTMRLHQHDVQIGNCHLPCQYNLSAIDSASQLSIT